MKLNKSTAILLVLAAVAAPAFAKKDKKADPAPAASTTTAAAPAAAATPAGTDLAATVGSTKITVDELNKAAANPLMRIKQQEYQVKMDILEDLIQNKLLDDEAAARKVSQDDLLKAEVVDKTPAPTQDEIAQYYEKMKPRLGNKTLEDAKPDVERALGMQKQNDRKAQFLRELASKNEVKILLDPPRVALAIPPTAPSMGPADAPIVMVEWSDYQCPFCKRAAPTVEQILSEYKGKIRFVYRDYPLPFHQQAMPSSIAAHCAEEQGKFWDYHNNLFNNPGDLSQADLTKRATDLGLDSKAFGACMDAKKPEALINAAYNDGAAVGVTGTPAFFINGRMLVGAQPVDTFRGVINDELERKGLPVPKAPAATAGTN
ncbi:MAG TPA: thioredoxin domain-containing protein [Candidatus Polarisedimenticolaceae bacterium]|nr:thioredoxin domain-containing protein [Candidatus Polarisedimenticolaceae bacterium]